MEESDFEECYSMVETAGRMQILARMNNQKSMEPNRRCGGLGARRWSTSHFTSLVIFLILQSWRIESLLAPTLHSPLHHKSRSSPLLALGSPICEYHQVTIPSSQDGPPRQDISVEDLTPTLVKVLEDSQMQQGVLTIISRHTTTAITINERESRLAQDLAKFLLELAPPDERSEAVTAQKGRRYLHNDIDQRPESEEEIQRCLDNGWNILDEEDPTILQKWRDQEPINAHSHLLSMVLGSSESIPVVDGKMMIGQWQSVLMVDLDGPRERTVGVQLMGYL